MSSALHSARRERPGRTRAFDVVAVVASQGGLPAWRAALSALPADFPAAIVYLQHRVPAATSALPQILRRSTALPVAEAVSGVELAPGRLYVAPARGLLDVADGRLHIRTPTAGDRRPGDWLLRSVAASYGPRAIAAVLTGRLDDGAAGASAVKAAGGRVLVQDPRSAECASMPLAALATGCFDFVLEPRRIGEALVALTSVPGAAELFAVRSHPWAYGAVA
jgi:two-component system, chemotaxis family, protein-glutamate methylesterase/glutaminase